MRDIDLIVIHCSASPNSDGLFRFGAHAAQTQTPLDVIDGWHKARGFVRAHPDARVHNPRHQHVGYHFIIGRNGSVFTGRSLNEPGAHALHHNARSLGICLVGLDAYTVDQWAWLKSEVPKLAQRHGVPLAAPVREGAAMRRGVCGHRELSPDANGNGRVDRHEWLKTCPGFDVQRWLAGGLEPLHGHVSAVGGGV
jgi:N-acetylmuramoyl-L-alanine amidase